MAKPYDKKRLHGKKYFEGLLDNLQEVPESVIHLLKLSRANLDMFKAIQKRLLGFLHNKPLIQKRVQMLMTIPGIGEVTALTWVLEVGETKRFPSIKDAVCAALKRNLPTRASGGLSPKSAINICTCA